MLQVQTRSEAADGSFDELDHGGSFSIVNKSMNMAGPNATTLNLEEDSFVEKMKARADPEQVAASSFQIEIAALAKEAMQR